MRFWFDFRFIRLKDWHNLQMLGKPLIHYSVYDFQVNILQLLPLVPCSIRAPYWLVFIAPASFAITGHWCLAPLISLVVYVLSAVLGRPVSGFRKEFLYLTPEEYFCLPFYHQYVHVSFFFALKCHEVLCSTIWQICILLS